MGNVCGMDIFQRLMAEHGESFAKIITAQESKKVVDQKVPQIKKQVADYYDTFQRDALLQVDAQTEKFKTLFETKKAQIMAGHQKEVQLVESTTGKKLNQYLKQDQLLKPIQDLKGSAKTLVSDKRTQILAAIDTEHQNTLKTIQNSKPKIPLYSDLDPEVRKQIDTKALEHFKDKIKQENDLVKKQLQSTIGVEKWKQSLKGFSPTAKLNEEYGAFEAKLDESKKTVTDLIEKSKLLGGGGDMLEGLKNKFGF